MFDVGEDVEVGEGGREARRRSMIIWMSRPQFRGSCATKMAWKSILLKSSTLGMTSRTIKSIYRFRSWKMHME